MLYCDTNTQNNFHCTHRVSSTSQWPQLLYSGPSRIPHHLPDLFRISPRVWIHHPSPIPNNEATTIFINLFSAFSWFTMPVLEGNGTSEKSSAMLFSRVKGPQSPWRNTVSRTILLTLSKASTTRLEILFFTCLSLTMLGTYICLTSPLLAISSVVLNLGLLFLLWPKGETQLFSSTRSTWARYKTVFLELCARLHTVRGALPVCQDPGDELLIQRHACAAAWASDHFHLEGWSHSLCCNRDLPSYWPPWHL